SAGAGVRRRVPASGGNGARAEGVRRHDHRCDRPTVRERTARVNTHDNARVTWWKSTRSNGSGACVEVAGLADGGMLVRDSKHPDGAVLTVGPTEWRAFLRAAKHGEFD